MSHLLNLQEQLLDTSRMISEIERAIAQDPGSTGLRISLGSLVHRREVLEKEFSEVADSMGQDVCSYRLIPDRSPTSVLALSNALLTFQNLFSTVYDALKNGPKQRARVSTEVMKETEFTFAYTYAGSIGVVFTLPNEKLLVGDTPLDVAMKTVIDMTSAVEQETIQRYSHKIGVPAVRAMYRWVSNNALRGLGVELDWHRGKSSKAGVILQRQQFELLRELLELSGEETQEEIVVQGDLIGADVERRSFHLKLENDSHITGKFVDAISKDQSVELPRRYSARMTKTSKIKYSTDTEESTYFLLSLEPLD